MSAVKIACDSLKHHSGVSAYEDGPFLIASSHETSDVHKFLAVPLQLFRYGSSAAARRAGSPTIRSYKWTVPLLGTGLYLCINTGDQL